MRDYFTLMETLVLLQILCGCVCLVWFFHLTERSCSARLCCVCCAPSADSLSLHLLPVFPSILPKPPWTRLTPVRVQIAALLLAISSMEQCVAGVPPSPPYPLALLRKTVLEEII